MRSAIFLVLSGVAASSVGCSGRDARAQQSATSPQPVGKKPPPTPEIVAKAEEILEEHHDAPIGAEFPVTVGGKAYKARIEEHENTTNDPNRPPGKHKGVTIYEK